MLALLSFPNWRTHEKNMTDLPERAVLKRVLKRPVMLVDWVIRDVLITLLEPPGAPGEWL